MTRPSNPSVGNRPGGNQPNISRPNISQPNINRPSFPTAQNRPSVKPPSSFPSVNRPSTGIGQNRPSLPTGQNRPSTRPSLPNGGDRPSVGNNRPGNGDRPNLGNQNLPSTLPGNLDRPGIGNNRPGTVDRPTLGNLNRPTTLPGNLDRPSGNNRPGIGDNRPGIGNNRPGGNNNIVNRPVIGGNRPGFGNDTNINIGNSVNVGNQLGNNVGGRYTNRPNWDVDPGYSRPGWGLNGGDWHNHYHDNCINHHHNWYNGCWHGYWGSNWYAPVAWGAVGWGLGYGSSYYNPYYAEPVVAQAMPYDYSQPVVVNNYVSSDADAQGGEAQVPQSTPEEQQALSSFDEGLAQFKAGNYTQALSNLNSALKQLPGDAVVHEVRCLALFANGDYKAAAAGLNSLLSAAPGMDWTTMSGLYGNTDDYTAQLRKLEEFCKSNSNDASAHFVLAYQYMVTGSKDGAIDALRVVVKNQPKDVTAKRMLDAMAPPEAPTEAAPTPTPSAPKNDATSETDLVGSWAAQAGDTKIELAISEDSKFTWKASSKSQGPVELKGQLIAAADGIELETADQGTIAGTVQSKGLDGWQFAINGAPPSDPGLSFARVK